MTRVYKAATIRCSKRRQLMMLRSMVARTLVFGLLAAAAACAPAPRVRPVKGGDVDAGPESLTAARKFLEGRWTLESFEVFPPGKPTIALKGSGTLNYDEFGNCGSKSRRREGPPTCCAPPGIEDPRRRRFVRRADGRRSAEPDAQLRAARGRQSARRRQVPLSPSRLRHWEVKGDLLFLDLGRQRQAALDRPLEKNAVASRTPQRCRSYVPQGGSRACSVRALDGSRGVGDVARRRADADAPQRRCARDVQRQRPGRERCRCDRGNDSDRHPAV